MSDPFEGISTTLDSPGNYHFSITPDNDNDLAIIPRTIRVGGAGNMVVTDAGGTDITYAVTAGELFIFRGRRIKATGTTATGLVGWY